MKTSISTFILFCICYFHLIAQNELTWEWNQHFIGESIANPVFYEVFTDNDGNVYTHSRSNRGTIIAGSAFDYGSYITKFTPAGELVWVNYFDNVGSLERFHVTKTGKTYLYGFTGFDINIGGVILDGDDGALYTAAFDENMNLTAVNQIPIGSGSAHRAVTADEAGNTYTLIEAEGAIELENGMLFDPDELVALDSTFYLLLKYDVDGNMDWHKIVTTKQNGAIQQIAIDEEGNVILAGVYAKYLEIDEEVLQNVDAGGDYWDIFVIKLASDGAMLGAKSFGSDLNDYCNDLKLDDTGNIYITGTIQQGELDFGEQSATVGLNDPFFAKLTPDLSVELLRVENFNTSFSAGRAIAIGQDGSIFMASEYSGSNVQIGDEVLNSVDDKDIVVARYSPSGNLLSLTTTSGECGDNIRALETGSGNKLYLGGLFNCNINLGEEELIYPHGSDILNSEVFLSAFSYNSLTTTEETLEGARLFVYPNPSDSFLTLDLPDNVTGEVVLYNLDGRLVTTFDDRSSSTTIDISNLNPGSYLVEFKADNVEKVSTIFVKY